MPKWLILFVTIATILVHLDAKHKAIDNPRWRCLEPDCDTRCTELGCQCQCVRNKEEYCELKCLQNTKICGGCCTCSPRFQPCPERKVNCDKCGSLARRCSLLCKCVTGIVPPCIVDCDEPEVTECQCCECPFGMIDDLGSGQTPLPIKEAPQDQKHFALAQSTDGMGEKDE